MQNKYFCGCENLSENETMLTTTSNLFWLVVNQGGSNAQFKGSGTINGGGNYLFMLWAGDDPDTFRIKIWEEDELENETPIYDNGFEQAIGGGSIVIHSK